MTRGFAGLAFPAGKKFSRSDDLPPRRVPVSGHEISATVPTSTADPQIAERAKAALRQVGGGSGPLPPRGAIESRPGTTT